MRAFFSQPQETPVMPGDEKQTLKHGFENLWSAKLHCLV
jgi:hypothetical protein